MLSVFYVIGLWLHLFLLGKQQILIIMCFIFGIYQCVCVCMFVCVYVCMYVCMYVGV